MIKLVNSNPPIFEFEIERDGTPTVIKVKALFWFEYDEDARKDKLETAIAQYNNKDKPYRNLDQWLGCFEFQQLDEWTVLDDSDNDDFRTKLIGCKSLLPIYDALCAQRKGTFLTHDSIRDLLNKPDISDRTITAYLARIEEALGIDLDRPRAEKKVSLKR